MPALQKDARAKTLQVRSEKGRALFFTQQSTRQSHDYRRATLEEQISRIAATKRKQIRLCSCKGVLNNRSLIDAYKWSSRAFNIFGALCFVLYLVLLVNFDTSFSGYLYESVLVCEEDDPWNIFLPIFIVLSLVSLLLLIWLQIDAVLAFYGTKVLKNGWVILDFVCLGFGLVYAFFFFEADLHQLAFRLAIVCAGNSNFTAEQNDRYALCLRLIRNGFSSTITPVEYEYAYRELRCGSVLRDNTALDGSERYFTWRGLVAVIFQDLFIFSVPIRTFRHSRALRKLLRQIGRAIKDTAALMLLLVVCMLWFAGLAVEIFSSSTFLVNTVNSTLLQEVEDYLKTGSDQAAVAPFSPAVQKRLAMAGSASGVLAKERFNILRSVFSTSTTVSNSTADVDFVNPFDTLSGSVREMVVITFGDLSPALAVMEDTEETPTWKKVVGAFFFFSYVFIAAFVLFSMVTSIITDVVLSSDDDGFDTDEADGEKNVDEKKGGKDKDEKLEIELEEIEDRDEDRRIAQRQVLKNTSKLRQLEKQMNHVVEKLDRMETLLLKIADSVNPPASPPNNGDESLKQERRSAEERRSNEGSSLSSVI
uniref:Ion transport domain-containing protein n=1 Tax=Palpitomonas bilix TaxID=652834 RepID=A0A7S3D3Q5_9EUKA|mmetsp:Transcript_20820/g.53729  ORF Transcript_20820/g.53729 Transcript_20820/m.53729 type:complete len:592 (+) Transcript_20820:285-2060(+)